MTRYSIPSHVLKYMEDNGYWTGYDDMKPAIEGWWQMLTATGDFYDFSDNQGGIPLKVHRRSIHPAAKVANEWASLLMNDRTTISTDSEECNEWLDEYLHAVGFKARGQGMVKRAFALGTGAWAVWLDTSAGKMQLRRYDARMILPITWDDDGVSECAFATRVVSRGRKLDQLQLHLAADDGYHIVTRLFDAENGAPVSDDSVVQDFATKCPTPTFALVTPAVENTVSDMSPYGCSVYADAIDAMQAVDLAYDAVYNEVDLTKARIFISDTLVQVTYTDGDGEVRQLRQALPFGRDNTVFRKVETAEDMVQVYAPQMRTASQVQAYEKALETMGDLCGFGPNYFTARQGVKTATEVSSDNSALMRNIRKHENLLEDSIARIVHAALACARTHLGASLPPEGEVHVAFDDSIITDTAADKAQDMAEVSAGLMRPDEYRVKWYGESEEEAAANVPGSTAELQLV